MLEATNYRPVLKLQGQLQPWQSVMVGARVAGTVEQLHVQLGDQVKAEAVADVVNRWPGGRG